MERSVSVVAPILRGLAFDGEKGEIVLFEDAREVVGYALDPENRNLVLSGPLLSDNPLLDGSYPLYLEAQGDEEGERAFAERVRLAYERHCAQEGGAPRIILYGEQGLFAIAPSYDDGLELLAAYERGLHALASGGAQARPRRPAGEAGSSPVGVGMSRGGAPSPVPVEGAARAAPPAPLLPDRRQVVAGRIAVVTGGAQGFGEEITRHLADAGALVFIADLNEQGAARLSAELNERYRRTTAIPIGVDIASEDSVRSMVEQIVRSAGGIDLFVANAGVLKAGSVKEQPLAEFELVTRVNYLGFFLCVKWVSPVMARQNMASGRYFSDIIQINSKSGLEGSNKNAAYAGSKFGGIGLTQSFALELVTDNIKVNAICPGNFFDGPLWSDPDRGLFVQYLRAGKVPGATSVADVKRFYEEKVPMRRGCTGPDVAKAILYIVEQKYETGQALPVTGGQVMLS